MIQVLGKKKVLNMENNKMNNIENLDEQKQKNNATQQTTNLNESNNPKQSLTNEPNVYIRTVKTDIETVTIELSGGASPFTYKKVDVLYPVFPSAINIKCNKREQTVQFDNKVMVNGKFGIYYINVNSSTAESSYDGVEASYFIRNDLNEDISDSCIMEYKDKLYVQRKSKSGKNRVL
jgi:hypothetical protein